MLGLTERSKLEFFGRDGTFDPVPFRLMAVYWGLVLLMPLGMLIAAASWLGVATTIIAIGLTTGAVLLIKTSRAGPSGAGLDSSAVPSPAGAP